MTGSGDKGLVGKIEKSTVEKIYEGEKWIGSMVCITPRKKVRASSSNRYGDLQYNCKATNFRSNIPRIISSTGCSNCRMETCLKGEEVEDACLFVGTKVFITGTKAKGVVTKVVAKEPWCIATFSNANIDQKIDFPFHKDYSVFSYDC